MDSKLKVLLLVAEPLRSDDGGGNTAISFFSGMSADFAQIYCSDLLPSNSFCRRYYQFSESQLLRNFFLREEVGHAFVLNKPEVIRTSEVASDKQVVKILRIIKALRWDCFVTVKYILALRSRWKTQELNRFITEFDPDVIYAPCYASPFLLKLTRHVKELTGKKVVTWSADDSYSLRQFSLSPFYWINRIWVRKCLRKTYPYYDAFYSISEDEIDEMTPVIGRKIDILRKGIRRDEYNPVHDEVHDPVRLIYAGGIYNQRWKTLEKIGEVIRRINRNGLKARLDIYTQNQLTTHQYDVLNDGVNIFTHEAVSSDTLKKLYAESDIALHVESFSLRNRLSTRLSFSTKITDCLASGCAVLAIAYKDQTGLKYLNKNNAAICITNSGDIEKVVGDLIKHPAKILEYARNARRCGENNHNITKIQNELYSTFKRLS